MKKPFLSMLGVAGACAACCAIPLALPLISGLSVAGLSSIGLDRLSIGSGAAVAVAVIAAVRVGMWSARRRNSACAVPTEGLTGENAISPTLTACACAPVTRGQS